MPFMTARSLFVAALALLSACAGSLDSVVPVARTDLQCREVDVREVGKNRYAASGCGKSGTYAQLCTETCTWVRIRSPQEVAALHSSGGQVPAAAQREVLPAPAPPQRDIYAAPPPEQREILPAPPPEGSAAPTSTDGQPAPQGAPQQSFTPQPTPLSQGELTEPYQAEVPPQPAPQRVETPPPAPLVESRPPPPAPSHVWVNGYWWWGGPQVYWTWVPGYWCAPRVGFAYVPGSWYWGSGYWWYGPGGWARPGSTLIVHHVTPRPVRIAHVRSFRPRATVSYGGYGNYTPPSRMGVSSGPDYRSGAAAPVSPSYRGQAGARPLYRDNGSGPAPSYRGVAPVAPYRGSTGSSGLVRGSAGSPAPRAYTPSGSPLNRYPTSLSRPSQAPARMGVSGFAPRSVPSSAQPLAPSSQPRALGRPGPAPAYRSSVTRLPASSSPGGNAIARPGWNSGAGRASPAPSPSFRGSSLSPSFRSGGGGSLGAPRAPSSAPRAPVRPRR